MPTTCQAIVLTDSQQIRVLTGVGSTSVAATIRWIGERSLPESPPEVCPTDPRQPQTTQPTLSSHADVPTATG